MYMIKDGYVTSIKPSDFSTLLFNHTSPEVTEEQTHKCYPLLISFQKRKP